MCAIVILGVDPGYAIVGWGVIEFSNNSFKPIAFGAVTTKAHTEFSDRLNNIYNEIIAIIKQFKPQAISIEKLYFQSNAKTAIDVAQARGVMLLAAKQMGIDLFEYTPLQVKTVVTGYGKAKKPQVMEMTRRLLHLKEIPKPDDTADALAIAITHTQAAGSALREQMFKRGIKL